MSDMINIDALEHDSISSYEDAAERFSMLELGDPEPVPELAPEPATEPAPELAPELATEPAPEPAPTAPARINTSQVVAGTNKYFIGAIVGVRRGTGELTRGALREVLRNAGLSEDLLPREKRASTILRRALYRLDTRRYKYQNVGGKWRVGQGNLDGEVGDAYGKVSLTATIDQGELVLEGPPHLCALVQQEYQRQIDSEILKSQDIRNFVEHTIFRGVFEAVECSLGYFVRSEFVEDASRFCNAMYESGWGVGWTRPALKVTNDEGVLNGLADGYISSLEAVMYKLNIQKAKAAEKGKQITPRVATNAVISLTEILEETRGRAELLGSDRLAEVRKRAREYLAEFESLAHDTALRGAMLELE